MKLTQWEMQSFLTRTSSVPLKLSIVILVLSLIAFTTVSFFYQVEKTVTAYGEIISTQGEKEIFAKTEGNVQEVNLEVGTSVKAGQILAQMKIPSENLQNVTNLLQTIRKFYDEQSEKNVSVKPWPDLRSDNSVIMKTLSESAQTWKKYSLLIQEADTLTNQKLKTLDDKRIKAVRKYQVLSQSKEKQLMGSLMDDLTDQINQIDESKASINADGKNKISLARSEALAQVKNTYLQILDYFESHLVRASTDGIIAKKDITSFQQVQKGQSLLSLLPEPSNFAVRLKIPSLKIGKIEADAKVKIAVDSYPYQKFGYFTGQVLSINQIVTVKESLFEVTATIEPPAIKERSPATNLHLLPGMKIKAFVLSKRMPLINIIYERVFQDENW